MSFFKKLKDRLFRSSSKIEEGIDSIVNDGGEKEPLEELELLENIALRSSPEPESEPEPELEPETESEYDWNMNLHLALSSRAYFSLFYCALNINPYGASLGSGVFLSGWITEGGLA